MKGRENEGKEKDKGRRCWGSKQTNAGVQSLYSMTDVTLALWCEFLNRYLVDEAVLSTEWSVVQRKWMHTNGCIFQPSYEREISKHKVNSLTLEQV